MALDITTTQNSNGGISIAWSGATGTVRIYRTTDSSLTSDPAAAVTAGTISKLLRSTTAASGTMVDADVAAGESYYYIAIDGSGNDYATITPTFSAGDLADAAAVVSAINSSSGKQFKIAAESGYAYVLLMTSAEAVESATITALADTGQTCTLITGGELPARIGYTPAVSGTIKAQYLEG